jgi:hypothetical protein
MMPMSIMVWYTLAVLPIYFALRWPFFKLPLHMDTGFYVSNHTVVHRKIDYSKGWNATFAGCSKVVPELFYSWIYLLHGGKKYKFYSRFYYGFYNFVTAIVIGMTMYMIGDRSVLAYCAALTIYCLLSSEPYYGVYFENGEQFEVLPQVIGFYVFVWGVTEGRPVFVASGIGLWLLESCFIKLSSLPGVGVLVVAGWLLLPSSLFPMIGMMTAVSILYVAWVVSYHPNLRQMFRALIAHETFHGRSTQIRAQMKAIYCKAQLIVEIFKDVPLIPLLALVGLLLGGDDVTFLLLYLLAVSAGYMIQVSRIWYYTIPFLPVVACLATLGVMEFISFGNVGIIVVIAAFGIWCAIHLKPLLSGDVRALNNYVWRLHGSVMAEKNLALDKLGPDLRSIVDGRSLFIFGAYNQGYVLLDASYDTPLISAYEWLNTMRPNWLSELNVTLAKSPPVFILDTNDCFHSERVHQAIGLRYRMVGQYSGGYQLYQLQDVTVPQRINYQCESFALPVPS